MWRFGLVHQTFLDYGPTPQLMRSANLSVRGFLTDLGTEAGINDFWDFVDFYIDSMKQGLEYDFPEVDTKRASFFVPFVTQDYRALTLHRLDHS